MDESPPTPTPPNIIPAVSGSPVANFKSMVKQSNISKGKMKIIESIMIFSTSAGLLDMFMLTLKFIITVLR